ncbi:MAG TPA: hypothetical protein VM241_01900 [Candidatus Thermoplasmatota archaeon]|nr:hypothetical protein [Candidatus Thermoplasmatota archaeon]
MTEAVASGGYSSAASSPPPLLAGTRLLDPTFARNVLLVLLANLTMVCVAVRHFFPGKTSVIVTAGAITLLVCASIALTWMHRKRFTAWLLLAIALVASRQILYLSTGIVFGVRDANVHIFGQTLGLLQTAAIPEGSSYTFYPVIHILLATVRLFTGIDLWVAASLLATVMALATALLVILTARALLPGSEYVVGALFLIAPNVSIIGTLYQPMSVTVLLFAAEAYLVARQEDLAYRRSLFIAIGLLLSITHPYSAATMDLSLVLMAAADAAINRRRTFVLPAIGLFGFTFLYSGFIAGDFQFFMSLFKFNIFTPATAPEGSGTVFKPPRPIPPSAAYRIVNDIALVGIIVPALLGWLVTLRDRRGRPTSHHLLAAGMGLLFGLGLLFAAVLQSRVVALAAIVLALFAAWGYLRFPRPVLFSVLPLVMLCALTSATATTAYFPWSQGDQNLQPLQDQGELGSLIGFYREQVVQVQGYMPPTVSSDPLFYADNVVLHLAPYTTQQAPGDGHAAYLIFRDSAQTFGYSLEAQGGTLAAKFFTPYPTSEQLRLLAFTDQVAQFGEYEVHQL